jgi:Mg-chelatase subunit ChlD
VTASWVRRSFAAVGVTQSPPGEHLAVLQASHTGKVLLCIDVSSSMQGRLSYAVEGAREFAAEAVAANYHVGLVLWNHHVQHYVPPATSPQHLEPALLAASASGGTDVSPTLELGIRELGPMSGDRVMAVFGDGDIGPVDRAVANARRAAALGIRIIVRGLGEHAAGQLNQIASDAGEATVVQSSEGIRAGIAAMARTIRLRDQA